MLPRRLEVKMMRILSVWLNSSLKEHHQQNKCSYGYTSTWNLVGDVGLEADSFPPCYLIPKLPHKPCWEQCVDHRKPWAGLENCLAEWTELDEQLLEPCDSRDNTGDSSVQQLQAFPAGFFTTVDKKPSASCATTLLLATVMPFTHIKHKHSHKLAPLWNGKIWETEIISYFHFRIPFSKLFLTMKSIWPISKL